MPTVMINGCEYFVEEHGTGRQTVVMAHDLMMSGRAWHNQFLALRDRYRCVEFDFRGHGRSSSPRDGYALDSLASDLIQLVASGGYAPMHFVGSGLGAHIGLLIALRNPELIRSLVLLGAGADAESVANRRRLKRLALAIRVFGVRPFLKSIMRTRFANQFLDDPDKAIQVRHWRNELLKLDRPAIAYAMRAFANRAAVDAQLSELSKPTLLLVGENDEIVTPDEVRQLRERVAHSRRIVIPDAGHCPAVEAPEEVNQALLGFLGALAR